LFTQIEIFIAILFSAGEHFEAKVNDKMSKLK